MPENTFKPDDRVVHVHSGYLGTIIKRKTEDHIESYWVKWDLYLDNHLVEAQFLKLATNK